MKEVYCWVIFIYRCIKEEVEILLISKDGEKYEPVYCENKNIKKAKEYLRNLFYLKETEK